ncbi:apolipoprotein N-acyltransferase [Zemynaea arenosa]|nr:apolipoprotein N-acyltransferase [Massilia arenosa]
MRFRFRPAPDPNARRKPRTTAWPMVFAALAGGLSLFSFAPFGWWWLQFPLLAFLFYQVGIDANTKRAAWIGWAYGLGWSVAGMHWLYIALTRFGGLNPILGAIAILLLGAYMGIYGAVATGVASWLRTKWSLKVKPFLLLVLPVMWGVSEWLRGWVFTGFPWAASGYAHNDAPLGGFAPILGVYGIGVLAALCGACIAMLTQRSRMWGISIFAIVIATGAGLHTWQWTQPAGQPIKVRLLQGDISQDEKFDERHLVQALDLYRNMITEAPADLIATPETAIAAFPQQLPVGYLASLANYARSTNSAIIYGIPFADSPTHFANSVGGFAPNGQTYRYDKHHLVPFGEFIPTGFRWFTDMMAIPLGDFSRGAPVQAPFAIKDQRVLPNVCYEDVFGEEIAQQLREAPQPATLLLNVSNLAWYGESVAIPQHLQISQMRSLETGRPMLRSTNNGATAVIDGRGKVQAKLAYYTRGVLTASVQGMAGSTPYIRFGNALFLGLGALALLGAWFSARRARA